MTSSVQITTKQLLQITASTSHKDIHPLFDYENTAETIKTSFDCDITSKYIFIFRNNSNGQVVFQENLSFQPQTIFPYELLGSFRIQAGRSGHKINFISSERRAKTLEKSLVRPDSYTSKKKQKEEIYLVVGSLRNSYNEIKGLKLKKGQTIKLGKVQFTIASSHNNMPTSNTQPKITVPSKDFSKGECRYCFMGANEEPNGFLFSPCSCSGSCGLVHFSCLSKWNQCKVRKEFVGGLTQYNLQRFNCEVCKDEYPRCIVREGKEYELLPIQSPEGNHIILEGITSNTRSLIVIEDIPAEGVKMGRGQGCEIRINDSSVSRHHATLLKYDQDYYIFDNKSRYGTLVRQENLELQLSEVRQDIQVGRTVLSLKRTQQ